MTRTGINVLCGMWLWWYNISSEMIFFRGNVKWNIACDQKLVCSFKVWLICVSQDEWKIPFFFCFLKRKVPFAVSLSLNLSLSNKKPSLHRYSIRVASMPIRCSIFAAASHVVSFSETKFYHEYITLVAGRIAFQFLIISFDNKLISIMTIPCLHFYLYPFRMNMLLL